VRWTSAVDVEVKAKTLSQDTVRARSTSHRRSRCVGDPAGREDELVWAVYGIDGLTVTRPAAITFTVDAAPIQPGGEDDLPLSYWIALSDYTYFRWEWRGPYRQTEVPLVLNFDDPNPQQPDIKDRYLSANGEFYFVVAVQAPGGQAGVTVRLSTTATKNASDSTYIDNRPHFAAIESYATGGGKASADLDPSQYVTIK